MAIHKLAWAIVSVTIAGALAFQSGASARSRPGNPQEALGLSGRTAMLRMRDCMDPTQNSRIAADEAEVKKLQESESGRATDLNPEERHRVSTKITDARNRLKLASYVQIVRMSEVVAREHGFDIVCNADRVPMFESGQPDLGAALARRTVIFFRPEVDITREVLDRLNCEWTALNK